MTGAGSRAVVAADLAPSWPLRVLAAGLLGVGLFGVAVLSLAESPPAPAPAPGAEGGAAATEVFSLTGHDSLFAVDFAEEKGWAVGAYGVILHSDDAGYHWREQASPTDLALLGVDFLDAERGVAVGQSGTVLHTADGGASWERGDAGTTARLFAVTLSETGLGFAVGEFGAVLRSRDHGGSWESLELDWEALLGLFEIPHLYGVAFRVAGEVILVGEFGLVLRSMDAGTTWQVLRTTGLDGASLFAVNFVGEERGVAVGQAATILLTMDGGVSWGPVVAPTEANLLDIWLAPTGEGVITGFRALLRSSDDGQSWRAVDDERIATGWYQGIALARGFLETEPLRDDEGRDIGGAAHVFHEHVYVVGTAGSILRLEN